MSDADPPAISESMQMYLVTIIRLRTDGDPVPLSKLAEALSLSPVSVNEMCRKLQDQGLVLYQPYKGVSLTPEGEQRTCYILRRHRLWEVFLVQKLGMQHGEAHQVACQLEHFTPDPVSDRLDVFLDQPAANPEGLLIPRCGGAVPQRTLPPLARLSAGQQGRVVRCEVEDVAGAFLSEQGLCPGAALTVMATAEESLLVHIEGVHISLVRTLAEAIQVEPEEAGASVG